MTDLDDFVKIVVHLPDAEDGMSGEGLWTKPCGEDLFEVQNSPWHSREINYLDVVLAQAQSPDKHPVFVSVMKRSGHRTVQVVLITKDEERRTGILETLNAFGATYEGANSVVYAFDFPPGVEWEPALEYLAKLDELGEAGFRYSAF